MTAQMSGRCVRAPTAQREGREALRFDDASTYRGFVDIYRSHYRDVFRFVLVRTANLQDAEDIASETFERAFRSWGGDVPTRPPLPWLLLTARRLITDRWRRARTLARRLSSRAEPTASSMPEVEAMRWLEAIAEVLTSRQREALLLRFHHDLSDVEIAEVMGVSPSGVRSLIHRAMERLRAHPEVWT